MGTNRVLGRQHAGDERGQGRDSPLALVRGAPVLWAKGFKLLGSRSAAAAAGSASQGTSSVARCAGLLPCRLLGTGFALGVIWAGETRWFPLEVFVS